MESLFKKIMFSAFGIVGFLIYTAIVFIFFTDSSNFLAGDQEGSIFLVGITNSFPMFIISFITGMAMYDFSKRFWMDAIIFSPGGVLTLYDIIKNPLRYQIMNFSDILLITSFVVFSMLGVYLGLRLRQKSKTSD